MHHVKRREEIGLTPEYESWSAGFSRAALVDETAGSVHMAFGLCRLEAGHVDAHLHSFEESFYVLDGEPILYLDGYGMTLQPGAGGVVPIGVPHAWRSSGSESSRWIEMTAPQPRAAGQPGDTFFVAPAPVSAPTRLDVRDPRLRNLFLLDAAQLDLDALKTGAPVDQAAVSASMSTALLAYSGIAVKMLVDQRQDAQLHTMFMVEYRPGGVAHPHDHPFEEAYFMLDGEIEAVADGERYTLRAGDAFWTGVGCVHAFYNTSGANVRWLETSAPQPPARHAYRFERDWEYLREKLADEAIRQEPVALSSRP